MRIGHGYDVHKLSQNRKLILGGEIIDFPLGLLGHSDADVLIHAIIDSIIGASALGDIGILFPDSDIRYKDANSLELLKEVFRLISDKGYKIINIDATVIAEAPKLKPYIEKMRKNIANACNLEVGDVSVKATTEEGLGFTGDLKGIAAHAVCLLE